MIDRRKLIQQIEEKLKSWGHNNAPGCVVCTTARMLIEAIPANPDARVVDGVIVTGPPS